MLEINPSFSQLGTRFWITKDTEALKAAYDQLLEQDVSFDDRTTVPEIKTSDRRLLSLVRTGVTDKFEQVFGRAKAFASELEGRDLPVNRALIRAFKRNGGNPIDIIDAVVRLSNIHEGQVAGAAGESVKVTREDARKMLRIMLATADFCSIRPEDLSESDKGKIRLSLINATMGALKLVREGKATPDSIFELAKGNLYDLAKGTDVYKLSVLTAQRAREKFIAREELEALADRYDETHPNDALGKFRVRELIDRVVAERTALSQILEVQYVVGDGKTASVEAQLKQVRERMRAFRYDLERLNGTNMGRMEGMRRWFDDIGGVKVGRITGLEAFAAEHEALLNLNLLLRGTGEVRSCLEAESTRKALNLTHTANNEIRYYFSGRERQYDAFSEKAHKLFDEMPQGGSRTVKFTLGATLAAEAGIAKLEGSVNYVHTATISRAGGEYTITHIDGAEVKASATVGIGFQDGSQAQEEDSFSPGDTVLGGKVGAGGSVGVGYKRSISYKSVADLIADLRGGSEIIDASYGGTRLCLGRIWMGVKKVGELIKDGVTALGFREHHGRMDQNRYQARLVEDGILGNLDQMLVQNARSLKTSETTAVKFDGGLNASASFAVGKFKGVSEDGENESISLFDAGLSAAGTVSRDAFVKSTAFRPLTEKLANHGSEWLRAQFGGMLDLPDEAADIKEYFRLLETQMRDLEARTEARRNSDADGLDDESVQQFAASWLKLAIEAELLKRRWEKALDEAGVPLDDAQRQQAQQLTQQVANRLNRPRVTMSDDQFERFFLEKLYSSTNGTVTKSFEAKASIGIFNGVSDVVNDKLGTADINEEGMLHGLYHDGVNEGIGAGISGTLDTFTPQNQTIGFKVTSSHKVDQNDVRPWANDRVTDISVSLSTNLAARALATKIADLVFAHQLVDVGGDRPDLKDNFINDLEFNLKWAAKDAAETVGNNALARLLGDDSKIKAESSADCSNTVALQFHFEGGRLTSIAETETMGATGELKLAVKVHGVKVGLKMSDSVTDVATQRWAYVNPSLNSLLAVAETNLRAGAGAATLKGLAAEQSKAVFRMARAMQYRGAKEAARREHPDDPLFVRDVESADACEAKAFELLAAIERDRAGDLSDRATALITKLNQLYARLDVVDFNDAEQSEAQLDVSAQLLTALASAFLLAREAQL